MQQSTELPETRKPPVEQPETRKPPVDISTVSQDEGHHEEEEGMIWWRYAPDPDLVWFQVGIINLLDEARDGQGSTG